MLDAVVVILDVALGIEVLLVWLVDTLEVVVWTGAGCGVGRVLKFPFLVVCEAFAVGAGCVVEEEPDILA